MKKYWIIARTALSLGVLNVLRLVWYKAGLRFKFNPAVHLRGEVISGDFFRTTFRKNPVENIQPSEEWINGRVRYFGFHPVQFDTIPEWLRNPFTGYQFSRDDKNWWEISDFDPAAGDIKIYWEASRFDWALIFAEHARQGNTEAIPKLNLWINDWLKSNPPYKGPNWKCGQETSIRVLHLVFASLVLGELASPTRELLLLIRLHLRRIFPTMSYAVAQDNNHGTSEAAALYIGGSILEEHGFAEGRKWNRVGRKWLENRVKHLVGKDGSFSQYSLNYHRMALDTLSMVEVIRQKMGDNPFSPVFYERAAAATNWLFAIMDLKNGDAPNFGANDGARLLPLSDTDYRDFRPSIQLASVLFLGKRAIQQQGSYDLPLKWLSLKNSRDIHGEQRSQIFDEGGLAVLIQGSAKALLRYPRFKFRPGHADLLHVDLWVDGENVLRDAGTFAYNTEQKWLKYFPETVGHNTIQFDGRSQMPRIGRFLFGDWLKTEAEPKIHEYGGESSVGASYHDSFGVRHDRQIFLSHSTLKVRDQIKGFKKSAVLRWRLPAGKWSIEGNTLKSDKYKLSVLGDMPLVRFELTEGWESLYYQHKTTVPVLEVEVSRAGTLVTDFCWGL